MSQLEFYTTRAQEARAGAEAATLANVRDTCLRSAAVWETMAAREQRGLKFRASEAARKQALLEEAEALETVWPEAAEA